MSRRTHVIVPVLFSAAMAAIAACSSSSSPASPGVDGGGTTDSATADTGFDAPIATDAGGDSADAAEGSGSATIAGSVGGTTFDTAVSAFWIGVPDLASTTAVYVIGKPGVACADISASGWAHTIPTGIQIFEMIMATQAPAAGTYAVSTATTPPAGSAEVNYIVSAPARNETRASAGTLTLTTLTPGSVAVGTFSVQFPSAADASASALDGTFSAVFCAAGHEP